MGTAIKKIIFILLTVSGLLTVVISHAQTKPTSITKVDSLLANEPKPVLILLSTDWCQYCQMQKQQVLKNKKFMEKSNLFYYVEFDAESKQTIRFQEKDYAYKPTGANIGTHELALTLNGPHKLAYPTWILLDKDYQVVFRHGGVLPPAQLEELLDTLEKVDL
ncbi:thioredoxin family protein [Sphingobacterium yanglingense]|uniref:Thioredoxin-related protein n=1 Tax=Sphingobacterium yanglingense TaxID=1437280 RepID=A0A4R6WD19_9SPHI|nr:thioredoxin family protein [Sphingobacterium yanglingense]TDQ75743.1 thioredoxin-related protein [Sphingobacterium yanglingense]